MVKSAKLVGAGVTHATRPAIKHLIGENVKVVHVTEGHGEWEGKLEHRFLNEVEKAENFVYFVKGTPCPHCKKRCTAIDRKNKAYGCKTWRAERKKQDSNEKEEHQHSSQPELLFTSRTVYRIDGNMIVLG